ncbi:MAG: hypothetical protein SCM11_02940 [Bacillota bacterium]|nr:hypothetical protein [Bacillota bacterium]
MQEINIPFSQKRWQGLLDAYECWWNNTLDRPLFNIKLTWDSDGKNPAGRPTGLSSYALDVPVEAICQDVAWALSRRVFLGDSYPIFLPDYGAGVNAAFAGANTIVRPETVWFEAKTPETVENLHLTHHPDDPIYRRIVDFYTTADTYFQGSLVLGMTHLNNGIDIPARLIKGVDLCIALHDQPEQVERLVWESHELFMQHLWSLSDILKHNPGFTCWSDILAPEPWFGTQCDFCAMIGPEHFDRFVLPELQACMRKMPRYNYYHLDGREELVHLDKILAIPELQIVQWVAGDDELPDEEWMWLYKKIRAAGKKLWYGGPEQNLDLLADTLGSLKGVYWQKCGRQEDQDRLQRLMERFGVPAEPNKIKSNKRGS